MEESVSETSIKSLPSSYGDPHPCPCRSRSSSLPFVSHPQSCTVHGPRPRSVPASRRTRPIRRTHPDRVLVLVMLVLVSYASWSPFMRSLRTSVDSRHACPCSVVVVVRTGS
ncbi:hypothetical protein BDZ89DRAFT_220031 [Hymenopellis radicata]|nr:hypothetical protein BDZ89DRAFT_220031 [Hymenopellis radicata]